MSFTLTFPAGPLGLTIAPAETTGHPSVVVKTVKPGCAHGARLRAGDELVAVGATSVRELCESATMDVAAFERLVEALREAPRPVALRFVRPPPRTLSAAREAAPWRPPAPGRKSLSSPPSPPRRAGAAPVVGDAPLLVDVDVENAPRILDVDVDRSPSPAVRDIEIARLPSLSPPPAAAADAERSWTAFLEASRAEAAAPLARHPLLETSSSSASDDDDDDGGGPPAAVGGPLDAARAAHRALAAAKSGAPAAPRRSASAASLVDEIEAPEALDTGDDGLSAEVEQPETVAALEAPATPPRPPEPSADAAPSPPTADPAPSPSLADPAPSPPPADPPAEERSAEEDRAAAAAAEREWAAFFAASVEQAATPRSDEDAAVAAAVFDFASEVLDPGEPGDDFPPLTSESSPYWPPPPEIVSEAPKSPEVADAEWRALKAGVVRSVVKAAEARLESVGADPAPIGRGGGALRLPGLAGPQSFSSDEARATEWRSWHRAHPRERKLEFAYGTPLPGLVSRAPPSESLSADTDAADDAASDMAPNAGLLIASPLDDLDRAHAARRDEAAVAAFDDAAARVSAADTVPPAALRDTSDSRLFEHVLVVGASVRTVATAVAAVAARDAGHRKAYVATVDAQVVHAYPAKSLPLELAETVCCFCAPDGITCRGDSLSLKAEAAEAATESGGHATVSTSVMAFGGGGEPLYAVVLSGLQRRDAHRSKKQTAVVMRSDLRVVLCTRRASLLALHLAAGALLAQDVAAALAAASRAKASPAACVDAANAAVARFACAFARVPVPPPGVRARWAPPVAIDEQALVPGLVPATPSKRPRADEHAVEDRAPPAPPELSRRERGRRDGLKRPDVVYCRSRGDVEAGQSVWDGDGAAILEWALPVLLSRLRLSHVLRAVAALLAELTVVVECADESDCSACVLALLTLARPLHPAGPLIVVLPQRFADYLDSPVPVLVGVTYGGPALLDRLRRPTSIPSLLARCDDDELRLFGGADPAVTTLPAADKLMNRLQAHADTIKRHVLRKGRRRGRSRQPAAAPGGAGAPAPGGVAGVLPPPSPARRGSSAGRRGGAAAGPPTPRTTGGAVLRPGTHVAVRDALRTIASTVARHVAVLAAASLELADGDRKEANLRALGLVHNAPEDTFLSPEDDEVNVPPWARCFVKSQLFANFRNALDEEGAAEWCNRLAAALKVDVDALATCRRALRRAPPAAIPADFASPASKRRWTSRGK